MKNGFDISYYLNDAFVASLNNHNLLSIERKREDPKILDTDSTKFAENPESLFNEVEWNELKEFISSGP